MLSFPLFLSFSAILVLWSLHGTQAHEDVSSQASFQDDIQALMADDSRSLEARRYTATPRMISYTRNPLQSEHAVGFNISMDISRCRRGLTHETVAGTYIYPDGTIKQNATMGDILTNLLAVRKEAPDLLTAERIVRNHTLTRARMAQDMSNKLLDGGLICRPSPGALSGETIHTELRRLLWYSVPAHVRREAWQFSILIFSSGLAGVGAGFTTALAAYVVQYRNNHGDERHNKTLTDREVRNEWIIAGVATFFATLAAGIADDIQLRRVLRFRVAEAFPADAFLAMTIDALRRLEMYPENSAPDSPGDNPRDIEMPTHPRRATIPCVDADIAANVARSFGDSLLPQVPQLGDVFHVEAPRVVEAEMLKEIVTDGRCTLAG